MCARSKYNTTVYRVMCGRGRVCVCVWLSGWVRVHRVDVFQILSSTDCPSAELLPSSGCVQLRHKQTSCNTLYILTHCCYTRKYSFLIDMHIDTRNLHIMTTGFLLLLESNLSIPSLHYQITML